MPAQYLNTWKPSIIVTANTAVVTALGTTAVIRVRTSSDVLLGTIPLANPAGTVNGTTGKLTLTSSGREENAPAGGTAAYAELVDSSNAVIHSLPCQQGGSAVLGFCVLNSTTVSLGGIVELVSWEVL